MGDYRKVQTSIWNDEHFPFMSDDGKLVLLHVMTSFYSNAMGLYKCSIGALADEMRWDVERYRVAFQEAVDAGFVAYDEAMHVIYLPQFLRDNPPANPNVLRGWAKKWLEVPKSRWKETFLWELEARLPEFGSRDDLPAKGDGFLVAFEQAWRHHCTPVGDGAQPAPVPPPAKHRPQPQAQPALLQLVPDPPGVAEEAWGTPEALMALYNAVIPAGHRRCIVLTDARRARARKYLRQFPERAFWQQAYGAIAGSPFLLGQCNDKGHENFLGDFDFFLRKGKDGIENCAKAQEGKYREKPLTEREQMTRQVGVVGVVAVDMATELLARYNFSPDGKRLGYTGEGTCSAIPIGPGTSMR